VQLDRVNELHLHHVKEKMVREREKSLEMEKKATIEYQREQ
jgi:hypothetical protein